MPTTPLFSLTAAAGLVIASSAAYLTPGPVAPARTGDPVRSTFHAEVRGDLAVRLHGAAEFGAVPSGAEAGVVTLALGARDTAGAVIFTRTDGRPLLPGTYVVSDLGEGRGLVRALVVTGPPSQPTGAFRGWSGLLTVTTASDSAMAGTFDLRARGFLARDPGDEGRRIAVVGSFTALRSAARLAGLAGGR
jgi:hypothetical protein